MFEGFLQIGLIPLSVALLASLSAALMGNFLILKRQALLGDTLSHVVFPGLVIAFLITGTRETLPMLLGAAGAPGGALALIALLRREGGEQGAAMGVVLTALFALGGVVL